MMVMVMSRSGSGSGSGYSIVLDDSDFLLPSLAPPLGGRSSCDPCAPPPG